MLAAPPAWVEMVEVNPPRLPSMTHLELRNRWQHVLITDNPFKQVRVSPYAFATRITHDVPDVKPTIVCSTRDRNILAIESEVRGAIANGVSSFLVVQATCSRRSSTGATATRSWSTFARCRRRSGTSASRSA